MKKAIENNKSYSQAAAAIGTSRVSFHNKMKKYRLHDTV
jgi:transcriptional regulator of acetoin/glycerol metabolism